MANHVVALSASLLLFNIAPSSSTFTNKEFSHTVGVCFTKALKEQKYAELPVDVVVSYLSHFNLANLTVLLAENGIPMLFEEEIGKAASDCLFKYAAMARYNGLPFYSVVLSDCACVSAQDAANLTTLPCDDIANLGANFTLDDREEVAALLQAAGVEDSLDVELFWEKSLICSIQLFQFFPNLSDVYKSTFVDGLRGSLEIFIMNYLRENLKDGLPIFGLDLK